MADTKQRWLTVEITNEIISRAEPQDCYECLIALALRAATGFDWHVTEKSARIETLLGPLGKMRRVWKLPRDVRELMRRFDSGQPVTPTTFRLPARFADKKWLDYGAGADWLAEEMANA